MNPTFNLITEPWIPVVDAQGLCREIGLGQALAQAHEFQAVAAPTPLQNASILRLMLAVLHRTHDTSSYKAWGNLWRRGRFDEDVLDRYWQQWAHRFDLFDPQRPFYQQFAGRTDLNPKRIINIIPGVTASGHFNHHTTNPDFYFTPAESARGLLVSLTFGTGIGCIPKEKLSIKASPWNAGLIFIVEGDNLFQTLASNMLRYDAESPSPELARSERDRPNWEADNPFEPREYPLGYLDYLTWPARRVLLKPEILDGRVVVRQFIDFVGMGPPDLLDPFKFYNRNKKAKEGETPYYPDKLQPNRAVWRNSAAILRLRQTDHKSPLALEWLAELKRYGAIAHPRCRLVATGMVADKTKVDLVREERIPLPLAFLEQSGDPEAQEDLLARLETALQQAEQVGTALKDAVFELAKGITPRVASGDAGQNAKEKMSSEEKNRIDHIANSISTEAEYWANLERPFYTFVNDLAEAEDALSVQARWLAVVLAAGRAALTASEARAGQSPKALKAAVMARRKFEGRLRYLGLTGTTPEGEQA